MGEFQGTFPGTKLEREELEQSEGAACYNNTNNIKHDEMEDAFMNFASATIAWDAAFTNLATANCNMSTKLRQQGGQIQELQEKLCNLKVESETRDTNVKGNNIAVHPYAQEKNRNHSGQLIKQRKI